MLFSPLLLSLLSAGPIPTDLAATWHLDPMYTQHRDVHGLPIIASGRVHPMALDEAAFLIEHMIGHRPDVLQAMADHRTRYVIMACSEFTTDIPEHRDLYPRSWWDVRARGLGATNTRPAVSCGEENLLALEGDPYSTENILIHEFAHAIHQMGLVDTDPSFNGQLKQAYADALEADRWAGTYAATNHFEYWAEGVQSWFNTNRENDDQHNAVNTREELKAYDPALATLCASVFGDGDWRYVNPRSRLPGSDGTAHLTNFERATARRFVRDLDRQQVYDSENARRLATARRRGESTANWLNRRITTGCFDAMVDLSRRYRDGDELPRSHALAAEVLGPAVEAGYPPALDHLGWLLWRGDATLRNLDRAQALFERAAGGGHVRAMLNLGVFDTTHAEHWWTMAAKHGHPEAIERLNAADQPPPARRKELTPCCP
jgi:hypothetical protein